MTDDDSSGRLWDDFEPDSSGDSRQHPSEGASRSSPASDLAGSVDGDVRADRSAERVPTSEQSTDRIRGVIDGRDPNPTAEPTTDDPSTAIDASADSLLSSFGSDSSGSGIDHVEAVLETVDAFGRMSTPSQVLVLGPEDHSVTETVYREILTSEQSTDQNALLVVAYDSRTTFPSAFADVVTADGGDQAVIEVGGRGLEELAATRSPAELVDVHEHVSSPKNLAKIGIMITKILAECDRTTPSTVMAVHTLTAISRYTSAETLFQFLHTLRSQLESTDVMGLFHLNPLEVDSQVVEMTRTLFDVVIEVTPDGEIDVQ